MCVVKTRLNTNIEWCTPQDTAVILNTWDMPKCMAEGDCPVPVFSLIKYWNKTFSQKDILVPFFNHQYGDLVSLPWREKSPRALMRAAAQVGPCESEPENRSNRILVFQNAMHKNCTRLWLLELAKTPSGQRLLDVGITNNLKVGGVASSGLKVMAHRSLLVHRSGSKQKR